MRVLELRLGFRASVRCLVVMAKDRVRGKGLQHVSECPQCDGRTSVCFHMRECACVHEQR